MTSCGCCIKTFYIISGFVFEGIRFWTISHFLFFVVVCITPWVCPVSLSLLASFSRNMGDSAMTGCFGQLRYPVWGARGDETAATWFPKSGEGEGCSLQRHVLRLFYKKTLFIKMIRFFLDSWSEWYEFTICSSFSRAYTGNCIHQQAGYSHGGWETRWAEKSPRFPLLRSTQRGLDFPWTARAQDRANLSHLIPILIIGRIS